MFFGVLTWVGFLVVAAGWALLLAAVPAVEIFANLTGRSPMSIANLGGVAQCAITTGLGLAIIGVLQNGFGALKKFFDAVLERTAHKGVPGEVEAVPVALPASERTVALAGKREPPLQKAKSIIERGRLKDRAYVLFGDGSIEVETLLGLRRFASIIEAQEFIG